MLTIPLNLSTVEFHSKLSFCSDTHSIILFSLRLSICTFCVMVMMLNFSTSFEGRPCQQEFHVSKNEFSAVQCLKNATFLTTLKLFAHSTFNNTQLIHSIIPGLSVTKILKWKFYILTVTKSFPVKSGVSTHFHISNAGDIQCPYPPLMCPRL